MFKIIWESKNNERLKQISKENNEQYLIQDENGYELLSELSTCSYDVFASKDMDRLIGELENVKRKAPDVNNTEHIDEIIELAIKCRALENSRLIFTPF